MLEKCQQTDRPTQIWRGRRMKTACKAEGLFTLEIFAGVKETGLHQVSVFGPFSILYLL
ncbi:unnamed protein product [Callosobruchus maculatus]|uniref:Uncharacterized protein n=1 Tax=Callosobruchus maculatus TaxID=64391 RepID=A0A653CTF2_CALMS|nr:unnamed protein product [Callosobruchus maculatus]